MVFMKLALSDNDMPNRSPIFQSGLNPDNILCSRRPAGISSLSLSLSSSYSFLFSLASSLVGSIFNASLIAGIISMIATNNNGLFVFIMISVNS